MAQRFDGIEGGGPNCGVDPEDDAYQARDAEAEKDELGPDDRREVGDGADDERHEKPQSDAHEAAENCHARHGAPDELGIGILQPTGDAELISLGGGLLPGRPEALKNDVGAAERADLLLGLLSPPRPPPASR